MGYTIRKLDFSESGYANEAFKKIGVTCAGAKIMSFKAEPLALKIKGLSPIAINILKQEALARGGEVATSRDSLIQREGSMDAVLMGTGPVIKSLIRKIRTQPFGLKKLADELDNYVGSLQRKKILTLKGKHYDIGKNYWIMGILNLTPDSFYDGGKYLENKAAMERAEEMIRQGADIIDVGGMSTRPGSEPVNPEEEIARAIPVIEHIKSSYDVLVSIDTYRSQVASRALQAGADIVNDISALTLDKEMAQVVAGSGAAAVLMHMRGTPRDMQKNPTYADVVEDVYDFLYLSAENAVSSGIEPSSIIIDPGIGFGKTAGHNLKLIKKMKEFSFMGFPLLLGASRKSFIEKTLGLAAAQRLEPSIAVAVFGYIEGVSIFRVHDVQQTKKALDMVKAIKDVE